MVFYNICGSGQSHKSDNGKSSLIPRLRTASDKAGERPGNEASTSTLRWVQRELQTFKISMV